MDEAGLFVRATEALRPADAVAALIVLEDGRYVMQLRDALAGIFYPQHWGCFGGAVDAGEDPLEALRRELREELEFDPGAADPFTRFDFDFARLGHATLFRIYYELRVTSTEFARFVQHEGADMQAFDGAELLSRRRVVPYDAFALWMHFSRKRFGAARMQDQQCSR